MKLFKTKADEAQASVAGDDGAHAVDGDAQAIAALEADLAADPTAAAAIALSEYTLTPGARSLLDRAVDNLATNDGAAIEDPEFKQGVKLRAMLLNAAGGDLSVAIACIVDACRDEPKSISGLVYSLCYNTLKQAVFYANLDYRRYLDPRGDFDLTPYEGQRVEDEALGHEFAADAREERRAPPLGMEDEIDREWAHFREVYGTGVEITEDIFAAALTDLRIYLQLTTEAFGWDAQRPMAFANIAEPNGTFTPITDARQALDHSEVQRKLRRKERAVKDNARIFAAAERAKEIALAAARRKS
jgi:hypothetical protein